MAHPTTKQIIKPCKHSSSINCDATCYSCIGCAWEESEDKARRARIANGKGLKKSNGLLRLCLGRGERIPDPVVAKIAYKDVEKLFHEGKNNVEIAKILGCPSESVRVAKLRLHLPPKPKTLYKISSLDGTEIKTGTASECAKAAGVPQTTFRNLQIGATKKPKYIVEKTS